MCVGDGVIVGSAVDVSVGVLAGSAGMGLPIAQAEVIIIVPAEKNKSFESLIFLIFWKTNLEIFIIAIPSHYSLSNGLSTMTRPKTSRRKDGIKKPQSRQTLCYNAATMKFSSYFANNNNNDNDDPRIVGRSMAG